MKLPWQPEHGGRVPGVPKTARKTESKASSPPPAPNKIHFATTLTSRLKNKRSHLPARTPIPKCPVRQLPYPQYFQAPSCSPWRRGPSSLNLSHPGREQETARPEAVEIRPLLEVGNGPQGPEDLLSKRVRDTVVGRRCRTGRTGTAVTAGFSGL